MACITGTVWDWRNSHVLSVYEFSKTNVWELFKLADLCRAAVLNDGSLPAAERERILSCCRHKVLGMVFYEPSTFQTAMQRLGGTTMVVSENSSVKKGETLQDTMRCVECYCDAMVLRHPQKGSVAFASTFLQKPIINAGDGAGEHPTQALLDLYSVLREQGNVIDGLTITLLGDLKYGRTTHSLSKLLCMFKVNLQYVTPPGLEMPTEVVDFVANSGLGCTQRVMLSLEEALPATDVLYVTRVQKERFETIEEYDRVKDMFVVDIKALAGAKPTLTILHPLPRVNEIAEAVDSLPGAAYFRQMENGMYVRMALIAKVLGVL
jgi:carbamoyl-phosphate synthase/aspartate carbamoyltransferase/dihydroorotase